jgi:hypothetical protein
VFPDLSASASDELRLFEIEAELKELNAQANAAGHVFSKAEEMMFEWARRNPKPTMRESRMEIEKNLDRVSGFKEFRCRLDIADEEAATREHNLAVGQWRTREQAAKRDCGHDVKKAAFDKLVDEMEALYEEAAEIPARTMDGLRCKARLVRASDGSLDLSDGSLDLYRSVVDDLLGGREEA